MLRIILVSFFIALLFNGCSYKSTIAVDKEYGKIKGLNQLFEKEDIIVYYVYGMGTHNSNETRFINFFDKTALEMGYPLDKSKTYSKKNEKKNLDVTIKKYTGKEYSLTFISIGWAMILNADQEALEIISNPAPDIIASVNKKIKTFMNKGFGDAVMYSNPDYKNIAQKALTNGLKKAYEMDDTLEGKPSVLLSSSLGSKVIFDIVNENINNMIPHIFKKFVENLRQIVMTSNQISLLDLFDKRIHEEGIEKNDFNSSTLNLFNNTFKSINDKSNIEKKEALSIIAYSDPNDALSYYIPSHKSKNGIKFTNVLMSHAKWWYLFMYADAVKAHGGFMSEDMGYKALIDGSEYLTPLVNTDLPKR